MIKQTRAHYPCTVFSAIIVDPPIGFKMLWDSAIQSIFYWFDLFYFNMWGWVFGKNAS